MDKLVALLGGIVLLQNMVVASAIVLPTPTTQQYVWHEQERVMFVCLDPCTWQGREYDDHSTDLQEMKLPKLDTDQWCETAVSWGAKEILFVAKHTGGFCWWQTDTTDYSVKNIAWKDGKGDVMEELAKSCAKYGLAMGIYVYPGDETWGAAIGSGGKTKDPAKQEGYNAVFRQQMREAITRASNYTRVTEVWFDGSCVIDVGDILEECAPDAAVLQGPHATIRWVGNERGRLDPKQAWSSLSKKDKETGLATAEHSDPEGDAWAALELDTTLYEHFWFWSKKKEEKRKSLDELMRVYYESAGQGAVMLLNSTPATDGLIPDTDVALYRALGDEIDRRFGSPLAQTSGKGDMFEIDLEQATLVNHVDIMEDYWFGERIRAFTVEGYSNGEWKTLVEGEHVGRKSIRYFEDAIVSRIRLRITQSVGQPLLKQFALYHVTDYRVDPHEDLRSAWTQCASWKVEGTQTLDIDLSPFVTEAGQWQVQFKSGQDLKITGEVLLQSGQASAPGALRRDKENKNTFNINRTAVITERSDMRLDVTITNPAAEGIVMIRRR
jgi:alpha-L-fucosidase